jgi:hypothetical protein
MDNPPNEITVPVFQGAVTFSGMRNDSANHWACGPERTFFLRHVLVRRSFLGFLFLLAIIIIMMVPCAQAATLLFSTGFESGTRGANGTLLLVPNASP